MPETSAPSASKTVTAALLIIGNEILSGRTRDANLQFLALEDLLVVKQPRMLDA